ncbi:hypothetical protein CVT25_014375 [Psilocybe cyanescens]|uniref:CxC6 like cysteine cluster associated with KDZ domain-containing protein n=1 Tax=Psilocybe cyanescens TaxID=93625 RepID=A0A409XTB3_PSICY|nr:hypothetical protein CVT25_014375 [Psilocybe cyanescens]
MANDDPAAVQGADENTTVPVLIGENAAISAQNTIEQQAAARTRANNLHSNVNSNNDEMDIDYDDCTMIVLDGLVMGPIHCAFEGCTQDVKNARGGAFCENHERQYGNKCCVHHERQYGNKCCVRICQAIKVENTQACQQHQPEWKKYKLDHNRSTLAGVRQMLQRPDEANPWQPGLRRTIQAHDDDGDIEIPRDNYFGPGRWYCVETMTAPCGVVIAWTKFDKSESPTKILNWLQSVYPTEESRPSYICIDKGCQVLRTSIVNRTWESWQKTSRFIVDSYHYINHLWSSTFSTWILFGFNLN